ncbi:type II toxin-antitoxin system RelB/DinJ family antitoxin [Treponema primitia]|uniref:type II toxin-antitoxin system RelB/DinJ family antitoxin n=1 Tax=Treponema primitia TaxID=88058 RepID=UPI003980B948
MAKTNNLHIRIDPEIQQRAGKVLKSLGMSIPDAITIFLNQVGLEGGIPFKVRLPKSADLFDDVKPAYCYGIELPGTYYGCQDLYTFLLDRTTPLFKAKLESWLAKAIEDTKGKAGGEWKEDVFWARVFIDREDKEYGASKSFEKLFRDEGLHLIYSLPVPNGRNEIGPELLPVLGFYLKGTNAKRTRIHRILFERLMQVFSHVEESELNIFEIFYEENWELPYDPNDPNFMTMDDY